MKHVRLLPILLVPLVLLSSLTAWSVYRERKQQRLNAGLIAAVKQNDARSVVAFLDQGADANSRDEPNRSVTWWQLLRDSLTGKGPRPSTASTPLILALEDPSQAHSEAAARPADDVSLILPLLDHKANPNVRDRSGRTALMVALDHRYRSQIHLLLAHGADPNGSDDKHLYAPLVIAAAYMPGTDLLADLLAHGADVNQHDRINETALMFEVQRLDVAAVRLLLAHGAQVTVRDPRGAAFMRQAESLPSGMEQQQIIRLLKAAGAKP